MKKHAVKCYGASVCLLLAATVGAAQGLGPRSVEGELLVKFRGGPRGIVAAQTEQALGLNVPRRFDRIGWQHVRVRPGQTQAEALARLRQRPDVIVAEPNYIFQLRVAEPNIPNDPRLHEQWALGKIGATNAWALTTGSSNVVVAVLDTGVRYTHEDLAANMWRNPGEIPGNGIDDDANGYVDDIFGVDAVNGDSDPMDQYVGTLIFHGTACASIIGAVGNNGRGITGLNWGVRIMALRLAHQTNWITSAWAAECFEYVLMMKERGVNVRVTSNSYGVDETPSEALRDAVEALGNAGVLSVFAAGNSSTNVDGSCDKCFRLPSTMNVAATDRTDMLAWFSNYGATNVDLAAPGLDITAADGFESNAYFTFSGTSASCPYVAGAAALLAAAYPSATVAQIKTALMETVDLLPALTNKMLSHGQLNAGRAIFHPGLSVGAPPHILTPPLSQTVGLGYPATFCVIATAAQPTDYYWRFEGSQIAHTTEPIVTLPNIQLDDAGNYSVILSNALGMATSAVASLTVVTNITLFSEPQGLRVLDGTNVFFRVVAAGAFPLSFQWRRNGEDLPNETNATIAFLNTQGTMSGDYQAVLSNPYGRLTTSVARLTVLTRPHIIAQPQSQTVAVGANVTLSVTVTNTASVPLGFRWRRGVIGGPTIVTNGFTVVTNLLNIQTNLSGQWLVTITNQAPVGVNFVLSSNAHITVVVPPTNKTVLAGANATFNVIGVGPAPLRYQWQRDGTNIPNATNTTLTLTNVQPAEAGSYSVVVTNALGQPTAFSALLQVVGPPLLTQPEWPPDGPFRTIITDLVPGQPYSVEISTNLTHWEPLPPFTATDTSMPFVDNTAPAPQKFFRARSGPP